MGQISDVAEKMSAENGYKPQQDSDLMNAAYAEIERLRRANEFMNGKLNMFNDMMSVFNLVSGRNKEGMGVSNGASDILWKLKERADVLSVVETMHPNMQKEKTDEAMRSQHNKAMAGSKIQSE